METMSNIWAFRIKSQLKEASWKSKLKEASSNLKEASSKLKRASSNCKMQERAASVNSVTGHLDDEEDADYTAKIQDA